MNKKITILIVSIIIIICVIFTVFLVIRNKSLNISGDIVITKYSLRTDKPKKKVAITSTEDINELSKYIEQLEPLSGREMVKLMLAKEVEVKYYDSISIGIQLGEKRYCYYINKDENISSLARIPDGLYEWIEEKIK